MHWFRLLETGYKSLLCKITILYVQNYKNKDDYCHAAIAVGNPQLNLKRLT